MHSLRVNSSNDIVVPPFECAWLSDEHLQLENEKGCLQFEVKGDTADIIHAAALDLTSIQAGDRSSATACCDMQARPMPPSYSKPRQAPGAGSTWPEALKRETMCS